MPLDQNSHQTVARFGYVGLSMYECGYSVPAKNKMSFIGKNDFFFPKSASSVRRSQGSENALDGQLASTPEPIGCTHCFWLFNLWFIDQDAIFFHFFHKITNIRNWRCFSSSKICTQFSHTFGSITMIFKLISQYFPALFKRLHNHIRSTEG